jgi:hypothetical protein
MVVKYFDAFLNLGPILQISDSAETFSDKFSASIIERISN